MTKKENHSVIIIYFTFLFISSCVLFCGTKFELWTCSQVKTQNELLIASGIFVLATLIHLIKAIIERSIENE